MRIITCIKGERYANPDVQMHVQYDRFGQNMHHYPTEMRFYLVFLSRNYRLIVAMRKFDVLKTNICFEGKYASFKNIKFPRGNYQTDSSETNTLLSLLFTTKFSSAHQLKNGQSPLDADQSNIYSCVQPVTNVNNSQRTLAK